ncbi:MAG: DMT family transporter [Rhodobacteraceae bacterium]|nr:MAG: DMT family transporter [Paracoccaceae bacterium]
MTPAQKGVAYMVGATMVFSVQDAISKHLAESHPIVFVVMIRYWFFALFVVALAARKSGGLRAAVRTQRPVLQIARGVLLVAEILVMVTSFHMLGLAPTHAVFACYGLIVTALAGPVLGETIGWRRWAAVGVGFLGVLIVIRPGFGAFTLTALIPFLAAFLFALYHLATRFANRADGSATSFFYTGVAGAVAVTLVGPFFWSTLEGWDWLWMGLLCVSGVTGHLFLILSLDNAEASVVQPFTYLQLVFASLIGVALFAETIDAATAAGAALIVGAGLFTIWRERVRRAG